MMPDSRASVAFVIRTCLCIHRYLGFALSLLFLVWFLSGFVMMYKSFPTLGPNEKLAAAKPIPPGAVVLSLEAVFDRSRLEAPSFASLAAVLERPVYRIRSSAGEWRAIYADTGEPLTIDAAMARAIAGASELAATDRLEERDQWTPTTGFTSHLPLFRVELSDRDRTVAYVSGTTGEIVQRLDSKDKFWAWLGPIPHWIYFRSLRVRQGLWEWTVIVLSAAGLLLCSAGLILGWARFQPKSGSMAFSPFEKRWFRWHHYSGFFFGIFVFTWTLSGLLSMNPFEWSPSRSLSSAEERRWRGGDLEPSLFALPPGEALELLAHSGPVKELELIRVGGRPYYLAFYDGGRTRLLAAESTAPMPLAEIPREELLAALAEVEDAPVAEIQLLTEYDDYYYATKKEERSLAVLRVQLADRSRRWYYLSPRTGAVVDRLERRSRVNRWLYNGLHSLDFAFLRDRRPHWDVVMLALMAGGTAACMTGVVLTYGWGRRELSARM
jgi:uncharacterized iron-regulated membrane protein